MQRGKAFLGWILTLLIVVGAELALGLHAAGATAPDIITLDPSSGPPGASVLVSGTEFGADEQIDVTFFQNLRTQYLGSTTSDSLGNFSLMVTIPGSADPGEATVRAQGAISRIRQTAVFTVTEAPEPSITLNPSSGPPGSRVTVTGMHFGSNEEVDALFIQNRTKFLGSTMSDSFGSFELIVRIPGDANAGEATIRAQGVNSRISETAIFTVFDVPDATLTLEPSSGPPGTVVRATGTHFGSSEEVQVLFVQGGRTQFLGSTVSTLAGNFRLLITIPENADPGEATIRAQGVISRKMATAIFTVT